VIDEEERRWNARRGAGAVPGVPGMPPAAVAPVPAR
jgi:hypothetical protein